MPSLIRARNGTAFSRNQAQPQDGVQTRICRDLESCGLRCQLLLECGTKADRQVPTRPSHSPP